MSVARCMRWLWCLLLLGLCAAPASAFRAGIDADRLPREARDMLERIERGGPYRYDRDSSVFGNYERLLPLRNRGYYREYTVDTPGVKHRGARRLVVGCERSGAGAAAPDGRPTAGSFSGCAGPAEVYYTDDHYRSFSRVLP